MSKASAKTVATAALNEAHAEREQIKHFGEVVQTALSEFNERATEILEQLRKRAQTREPLRLVRVKK